MKSTKRSLFTSVIALILCLSMLSGTTFAWFTDITTSKNNVVQTGELNAEMYYADSLLDANSDQWKSADGVPVFTYDKWEPGYTDIKYIKIANEGNLSFKWKLTIESENEVGKLAEVIDVYYVNPVTSEITSLNGLTSAGILGDVIENRTATEGIILPTGETSNEYDAGYTILAIAFHMQEDAGNEYQEESVGAGFSLKLLATQFTYESDAFGSEYDSDATFPEIQGFDLIFDVPVVNGAVSTDTTAQGAGYSVTVPAGVKTKGGQLGATVTVKNSSDANLTLNENEVMLPLDVHVEGLAEDNTVPVIINLGVVMPVGLNIGNYTLYHVEDGVSNAMTAVSSVAELDTHNDFYYDPTTGEVTVAMKSFSEVALVADSVNAWEGNFDYSWYDASKTELTIANADQLAAFGAIVGGMKKVTGREDNKYTYSDEVVQDSFAGKTVKLLADINLGDAEEKNNPDLIFYPIGYWNSEEIYEKTGTAVSSGFYTFQGTFDGNGNTISNFYQNTWEMKGDHDWYDANLQYFRDGMGLFGRVLGGTIKNLTVDNFSCDSEIGTTGVIAAYADSKDGQPAVFENISITNCNPRVYNIGNGGIVGCAGWYSRNDSLYNEDYTNAVVFKNITVDQTNKISALWGSWGVSCAGILGQYYPNSNCGIKLENCHVAAIIDVNNDVCSNYQYYWYRYAGLFIGTIRANKVVDGYTIADTTGVFATDCTYTMGDWNEYWYCEIVANSLASYTHDHQFSRLEKIKSLSEIQDENGNWNKEGHFVIPAADNSSATCYHIFKNSNGELYQHFHDVADESNPNIYEDFDLDGNGELDDLKEDRVCYFIPFNQLMTGLDMGIRAFYDQSDFEKFGIENIEFKHEENGTVKSEEKFEKLETLPTFRPGQTVKLGDLVKAIVDETKIDSSVISIGSTVKVYDYDLEEEVEHSIVGSNEVDPLAGKISDQSPIGHALMGKAQGAEFSVETPAGTLTFKILEVSRK